MTMDREMFDVIKAVADAGVPVMSHVGLLPHHVHRYAMKPEEAEKLAAALTDRGVHPARPGAP